MGHTAADFGVNATNTSAADITRLNTALAYLDKSFTGNTILNGMVNNHTQIAINHAGDDHYANGVVSWDPTSGLGVTHNGVNAVQSAAIGLIHEGAHATDLNILTETRAQAEAYATTKETAVSTDLGDAIRDNYNATSGPVGTLNATEHTLNRSGSFVWQENEADGSQTTAGTFNPAQMPAMAPAIGGTVVVDNKAITIANGCKVTVQGNGDTITDGVGTDLTVVGSGDAVTVGGNGATSATPIDTVRISNGTVTIRDGSRVDVIGNSDTVSAGKNDYFGVYGSSEVINALAGDGVWTGTNGSAAPVIDTVNGSGISVTIADNSRVDVKGDNDTVFGGKNDNFGVYGAGETINGGIGDGIWVGYNGSNAAVTDRVNANGDTVTIAPNSRVDVFGNNDTVIGQAGDNFGVYGSFETISAPTGDGIWINGNGGAETGDKLTVSGDTISIGNNATQTTITGNNDVINGGTYDFISEFGNGNHSVFGLGSKITDTGSNDTLNGLIVPSGIMEDINSSGGWYTDGGSSCTPTWVPPTYSTQIIDEEVEYVWDDEFGEYDEVVVPVYGQVQTAPGYYTQDPVVLNLKGGAVETTSLAGTHTSFDMRNDGSKVPTAWVTPGEGLLVVDREHNGAVSGEASLVGGMDDLAHMANSASGKLDASNPLWADLKVWVDQNGDAVAQPGELQSFEQLGIASIDLRSSPQASDNHGNTIRSVSTFSWNDGSTGNIAGVDLAFAATPPAALNHLVDVMAAFSADDNGSVDTVASMRGHHGWINNDLSMAANHSIRQLQA